MHRTQDRQEHGRVRGLASGGVRVLAVGIAFLLAVAACTDDDDGGGAASTSDPAETTTTSAALTGDPVKVMVVFDQSPELVDGAIAAAEAVNRAGGLGGRPIEVVPCDTKTDPNEAAGCGRRAVDEGVVSLVGSLTPLAGSFMPTLAENKIPSVGNLPVTPDDFTSPASFPIDGGLVTISAGLGDAMALDGATKISVVRVDLPLAGAIRQFANAGLARHDLEVVNDISVPQGAPDMAPYVAAALADGADALLVGLFGQDATNFLVALRQQDSNVKVGLVTTDLDGIISALESEAEGMIVTSPVLPRSSEDPAVAEYLADIEAAGFDDPGNYRINAYAATMAFAEIARDLPEITSTAVFDALSTATGVSIGLSPDLQFTTGGGGGLPRVFNPCVIYLEVTDGELETISDGFVDTFSGEPCS